MATKTTACQWQLLHAHTKLNYILLKRDIIMAFVSPHPSPSPIPSQNKGGNINTYQTLGDMDKKRERGAALRRDEMENAGFNRRSNWDQGWMHGAALKYWLTYGSGTAHASKTFSLSIVGGLRMLSCIKFGQAGPWL